jgi:hypothetical protein
MLQRIKRLARRLHEDDRGLNTVEAILLLIVAIIVLIALWKFVQWALEDVGEKANEMKQESETGSSSYQGPAAGN